MALGKLGGKGGMGRLGGLAGASTPGWVLRSAAGQPAVMQRDPANGRYWYRGMVYLTEAAFNSAVGGIVSGNSRIFGPFNDPTSTNLITNGSPSVNTAGWSAFNGGVLAANAGELVLTSGGNLSSFSQGLAILGRAGRFSFTGRRITTTNSFIGLSSAGANLGTSGGETTGAISSTTPTAVGVYASALGTTTYFGVRNTSATGTLDAGFTGLSFIEAWPFLGWTPNNIVVLVEATSPASASFDQVVWQADAGSERSRIRLVRLVADNTVHLIITTNNNLQWDSGSLGVVAPSAPFSVAMSLGQTPPTAGNLSGGVSMNGGAPVLISAGVKVLPGATVMRVGTSFTAGNDNWTGTDPLVAVF